MSTLLFPFLFFLKKANGWVDSDLASLRSYRLTTRVMSRMTRTKPLKNLTTIPENSMITRITIVKRTMRTMVISQRRLWSWTSQTKRKIDNGDSTVTEQLQQRLMGLERQLRGGQRYTRREKSLMRRQSVLTMMLKCRHIQTSTRRM